MKKKITIKGAREHNLKNIQLTIPRDKMVIVTGVSGSGKTSLAFDTLYAEGQRRYVESLSSYARQFLGQMEKPKVDYIDGLSPAISIQQKTTSRNPRSTVGTITEIHDYLRVLFARIGTQYCFKCGKEVGSLTVDQIAEHILHKEKKTKLQVLSPIVVNRKGQHKEELEEARLEGFVRVKINGKMMRLSDEINLDKKSKHTIDIVVDRLVLKDGIGSRLKDSLETAMKLSGGMVKIDYVDEKHEEIMSETNACADCGIGYPDLSPQSFSFNSPLGCCPECKGLGTKMEFDIDKLVPNKNLSIYDGAVIFWGEFSGKKQKYTHQIVYALADFYDFSLKTPWKDLPKKIKDIILKGSKNDKMSFTINDKGNKYDINRKYEGIIKTLNRRMKETRSQYMRKYYMKYLSTKKCPVCSGFKLRNESLAVKIKNKNIYEVSEMNIEDALSFFKSLELKGNQLIIAEEVLKEITDRLNFLLNVGLHYLTLNRKAPTLSGGEAQRIRLASQIGNKLVGVMYILDEPTIGLHQRDNDRLIKMLLQLRDLGNTVIVIEHDEDMIRQADHIIDIGPNAGVYGGKVVAEGSLAKVKKSKESLTGKYLSGKLQVVPDLERVPADDRYLILKGATKNNLKDVTLEIPVGLFTCVTGVSGSGKSSLINQTLYPILANKLNNAKKEIGDFKKVEGIENFDKVIAINQRPIGRTPRSNPATYTKVFDEIRNIFASTQGAKIRGYKKGRFSFNVKGGRCEACGGAGYNKVEMHFLADVYVTCEVCKGSRFNKETMAIKYKGKSIADVLDMDIQEAYLFFDKIPKIKSKLETLMEVGLEYLKLGQASTTLSGGESQRIKLAKELSKRSTGKTIYILDEPTTGLHFDDVRKLLKVLKKLVRMGNTIIVIEHNMDVIKSSDHIIDLGPEGGDKGGYIVSEGSPEEIVKENKSYTAKYLKPHL